MDGHRTIIVIHGILNDRPPQVFLNTKATTVEVEVGCTLSNSWGFLTSHNHQRLVLRAANIPRQLQGKHHLHRKGLVKHTWFYETAGPLRNSPGSVFTEMLFFVAPPPLSL